MSSVSLPPMGYRSITFSGFNQAGSFFPSLCPGAFLAASSRPALSPPSSTAGSTSLGPDTPGSAEAFRFLVETTVQGGIGGLPNPPFGGPEHVLQCLNRHTHRVPTIDSSACDMPTNRQGCRNSTCPTARLGAFCHRTSHKQKEFHIMAISSIPELHLHTCLNRARRVLRRPPGVNRANGDLIRARPPIIERERHCKVGTRSSVL
jgi:hypothetical protein